MTITAEAAIPAAAPLGVAQTIALMETLMGNLSSEDQPEALLRLAEASHMFISIRTRNDVDLDVLPSDREWFDTADEADLWEDEQDERWASAYDAIGGASAWDDIIGQTTASDDALKRALADELALY